MKLAMLFPGYGSQYVGMGKELYDQSRIIQEYFEEASNCLNINFVKLCFASSDAEISRVDNALLSSFLVSSSLYALLKEEGIIPDLVTGHNSGEYAAIFAGGGISLPDMLYMLQKYGNFYMDVLNTIPVRVIRVTGLEAPVIEQGVAQYQNTAEPAYVCSYETQTEHIVCGYEPSIIKLRDYFMSQGAKKVIDLQTDGLHCVMMKSVYDSLTIYSEKVDFKDLHTPLLTTTRARIISSKEDVKTEMLQQLVIPVRWVACVRALNAYDILVEVGPGTTLSDKLKKQYPNKKIIAINKDADVQLLKTLVTNAPTHQPS